MELFVLFHRYYVNGRINFDEVGKAPYHRQGDRPEAKSIMNYLMYIKDHDAFKEHGPADYHQMLLATKKQRLYYNTTKKRDERHTARRLDRLFAIGERTEGMKGCSVW